MASEPPEKRQKYNDADSSDVADLVSQVAMLRREGPKIIHDVMSAETKDILRALSRVQVEVQDSQLERMVDIKLPQPNCPQDPHKLKELMEFNTLLKVLNKKAKCPIARLVDEI